VASLLFGTLPDLLGRLRGYLAAYAFYWVAFGFALPVALVGAPRLLATLRPAALPGGLAGAAVLAALLVPPVIVGATAFRERIGDVTPAILAASAAIATVNGVAEEMLWRAAPVAAFPHQPILALALPALGFGVWHLAPLIALPTGRRGGAAMLVAEELLFGLCWGSAALVTGSVSLVIVSHVATGFLGLTGFAYLRSRSGVPAPLAEPSGAGER
jgi:uncharacterized protein